MAAGGSNPHWEGVGCVELATSGAEAACGVHALWGDVTAEGVVRKDDPREFLDSFLPLT